MLFPEQKRIEELVRETESEMIREKVLSNIPVIEMDYISFLKTYMQRRIDVSELIMRL
jgi:hypothetical protein